MAFQLVEAKVRRVRSRDPQLTIRSTGVIGLNAKALELANGEHVEIYHDADTRRVGLKFLSMPTDHSMKLGKGGISAKPKLLEFMDLDANRRYDVTEEAGMLVIELDKATVVPFRQRKKE